MMEKRSGILVIGGGPSGLRVAGRLAAAGLDVTVLEKKTAIGENVVCTGIVSREVFARFGLDIAAVVHEIGDVHLVSPFGTVVPYRHPRPFACVVDRAGFDAGLAAAAVRAGAELVLGSRVDDLAIEPGGVRATVLTQDGEQVRYAAALAVIATGIESGLQKKAGLAFPRDFLKGAQAEIPLAASGPTTIYFGRSVAPGAFAWSVPAGGAARVGLLTRRDARAYLRKLLDARGAGGEAAIRTRAIAQGLVGKTTADRVLAVGEAAGQIKTTTGGGISYGLLCADIAAEVVAGCFARSSFDAGALAGYETRWRQAVEKEIVVGYYTRRMCARLGDRQVERLFHLAQTDGLIPIIRDTADFDWHSALVFALLERLSFMRHFRAIRENLGKASLS